MDGLLLVDKPAGPTSHDVVNMVRSTLGFKRVGHCGTLDPFATGLLLMLVGRTTRLSRFMLQLPKRYEGTAVLGTTTDTYDVTGKQLTNLPVKVGRREVHTAMKSLTGSYLQNPPAFSAKKVGGVRAYAKAKLGEEVRLEAAKVTISKFELCGMCGTEVSFVANVSTGTYVRSLVRDLGEKLECGAYVKNLTRTHIGDFSVENAAAPTKVDPTLLLPPPLAVAHLPQFSLTADEMESVRHGRLLKRAGPVADAVALTFGTELIGVARSDGTTLQPHVVLA